MDLNSCAAFKKNTVWEDKNSLVLKEKQELNSVFQV